MASAQPPISSWRAACLRGISTEAAGLQAVVALSAEQCLLLPLPGQDLAHWRAQVGRRVWVNVDAQPMRLSADDASEARHA
jgi:hypothetical protein